MEEKMLSYLVWKHSNIIIKPSEQVILANFSK